MKQETAVFVVAVIHGEFSEGDKRMHMSKVIEAGTKFSSEANEYISELVRSGIIEEYREVVSDTVLSATGGESGKASGQSGQEKGEKKEKEKK